jgi:hypothetical protein
MWQYCTVLPNFKKIPASEFLEEEEPKEYVKTPKCYLDGTRWKINPEFASLEIDYGKSLVDRINNINNPSTSPRTGKGKNKIMSNIVNFAKNLVLSADEKLLRKSHLKDEYGEYTAEAEDLVRHKLLVDNEPYLLEIAKAKQEEDNKNK